MIPSQDTLPVPEISQRYKRQLTSELLEKDGKQIFPDLPTFLSPRKAAGTRRTISKRRLKKDPSRPSLPQKSLSSDNVYDASLWEDESSESLDSDFEERTGVRATFFIPGITASPRCLVDHNYKSSNPECIDKNEESLLSRGNFFIPGINGKPRCLKGADSSYNKMTESDPATQRSNRNRRGMNIEVYESVAKDVDSLRNMIRSKSRSRLQGATTRKTTSTRSL